MELNKRIRQAVLALNPENRVADVRIGRNYTAVQLDDGRAGAAVNTQPPPASLRHLDWRGLISGLPVAEVAGWLTRPNPARIAVALATCNALVNRKDTACDAPDVLAHVAVKPGEPVGMVGYFPPLVPALQKQGADLTIFEMVPAPADIILPCEEAHARLPDCRVAIITAATLANDTIDTLLEACWNCRQVVVLGPSTPLLPMAFAGTPVTYLGGVVVTAPRRLIDIVAQGGDTPGFRGLVEKIGLSVTAGVKQPQPDPRRR
jgi:uncharacterized protein (DUF4213/DUF364 family)